MAKNAMTPEQDVLTRRFWNEVAVYADTILPNAPATARQLRGIVLSLLNYRMLPNGNRITADADVEVPFGSNDFSRYPDEWDADYERALEELDNEGGNNTDTSEASTSESSEDTEVREAVLSKDVS